MICNVEGLHRGVDISHIGSRRGVVCEGGLNNFRNARRLGGSFFNNKIQLCHTQNLKVFDYISEDHFVSESFRPPDAHSALIGRFYAGASVEVHPKPWKITKVDRKSVV